MLLKLCRLILGCAIKVSRGTVAFPDFFFFYGYFVHFLNTLGLINFPKILADLFLCPKRHFTGNTRNSRFRVIHIFSLLAF